MRKLIILFSMLLCAATIFVVGDYYAVFGTENSEKGDFMELRFRMIDGKTGAPVIKAYAKCFQRHNQNACTQRDSGKLGVVSINVPVQKIITHSYLFEHAVALKETLDPKLQVLFFHPDYGSPVESITIAELPELSGKVITVSMPESVRNR